jgi:hypothetical protein
MATPYLELRLAGYEPYIRDALAQYSDITDGRVQFQPDKAARLELMPDKSYLARSVSEVTHAGETALQLHVLVLTTFDGTGVEGDYTLAGTDTSAYRPVPGVLPRSKAGTHAEAHLTIATRRLTDLLAEPINFAGNLSLLGFQGGRAVTEIGSLGQGLDAFAMSAFPVRPAPEAVRLARPTVTYTVGYRQPSPAVEAVRFGDPHAVYNPWVSYEQVCAFLAVPETAAQKHLAVLSLLGAVEPA